MKLHLQSRNLLKSIVTLVFGTACLFTLGVCCFESSVLTMPTITDSLVVAGIIAFFSTVFVIVYMWVHRMPEKEVFLYACLAPALLCIYVGACGLAGEEIRVHANQHGVVVAESR